MMRQIWKQTASKPLVKQNIEKIYFKCFGQVKVEEEDEQEPEVRVRARREWKYNFFRTLKSETVQAIIFSEKSTIMMPDEPYSTTCGTEESSSANPCEA